MCFFFFSDPSTLLLLLLGGDFVRSLFVFGIGQYSWAPPPYGRGVELRTERRAMWGLVGGHNKNSEINKFINREATDNGVRCHR